MLSKSVGKFRKFSSSESCGGETWARNKGPTPQSTKQEIVQKLRTRAEKYEAAAETAPVNKAIIYTKIAQELRSCTVSIQLNDWNDMDEI